MKRRRIRRKNQQKQSIQKVQKLSPVFDYNKIAYSAQTIHVHLHVCNFELDLDANKSADDEVARQRPTTATQKSRAECVND